MILKKNKTDPRRLKSSRINNWKRRGVVGDLNELYDKDCNNFDRWKKKENVIQAI